MNATCRAAGRDRRVRVSPARAGAPARLGTSWRQSQRGPCTCKTRAARQFRAAAAARLPRCASVCATGQLAAAADEIQSSAGARSATSPVLELWKGSTDRSATELTGKERSGNAEVALFLVAPGGSAPIPRCSHAARGHGPGSWTCWPARRRGGAPPATACAAAAVAVRFPGVGFAPTRVTVQVRGQATLRAPGDDRPRTGRGRGAGDSGNGAGQQRARACPRTPPAAAIQAHSRTDKANRCAQTSRSPSTAWRPRLAARPASTSLITSGYRSDAEQAKLFAAKADLECGDGDGHWPARTDALVGSGPGVHAAGRVGLIGPPGRESFARAARRGRDREDGAAGVPGRVRVGPESRAGDGRRVRDGAGLREPASAVCTAARCGSSGCRVHNATRSGSSSA